MADTAAANSNWTEVLKADLDEKRKMDRVAALTPYLQAAGGAGVSAQTTTTTMTPLAQQTPAVHDPVFVPQLGNLKSHRKHWAMRTDVQEH